MQQTKDLFISKTISIVKNSINQNKDFNLVWNAFTEKKQKEHHIFVNELVTGIVELFFKDIISTQEINFDDYLKLILDKITKAFLNRIFYEINTSFVETLKMNLMQIEKLCQK